MAYITGGYGAVKAVLNGDGSYSLQLANGDILQSIMPVFAWPGITIPNIPTLSAANTFEHGAVVRLHQNNFTGVGANPLGIEIQADAVNNIWRPHGRQVIWSSFFGLLGSTTVSLAANGRFGIGTDPIVPAGLLNYTGARLRFNPQLFVDNLETGGTGPTVAIHIGTDLSSYTNNPIILNNQTNSSNGAAYQPETLLQISNAINALTNRNSVRGGAGENNLLSNVTTGINFASNQMITFAISNMATATKVDMHAFEIAWEY